MPKKIGNILWHCEYNNRTNSIIVIYKIMLGIIIIIMQDKIIRQDRYQHCIVYK